MSHVQKRIATALLSSDEITIQPPVGSGRSSSYIQIKLAAGYHPTNQWMDLITNILPVDTTDPDSDWKDLSRKTFASLRCKWGDCMWQLRT